MSNVQGISAPGRGDLTSSRLKEHLQGTLKRLKKLGVRPGVCVASALPEGPDATTAHMTANLAQAEFVTLSPRASLEQYQSLLLRACPGLLLLHSGAHPARDAARSLGIPIASVLRHFEAGIFTLEIDATRCDPHPPVRPAWKRRGRGVPIALVARGSFYRPLANRLDAINPVIGLTPPDLQQLPFPHTIEHLAAECVRMLRRSRPQGPYAVAGFQADALVALEMARLLEEEGDRVVFVAMLDAFNLFDPPVNKFMSLFRRTTAPPSDFIAEALRQYQPRPWFGRMLHLGPKTHSSSRHSAPVWRELAPQGFASYESPSDMLAEPHVNALATILAAELVQAKISLWT